MPARELRETQVDETHPQRNLQLHAREAPNAKAALAARLSGSGTGKAPVMARMVAGSCRG